MLHGQSYLSLLLFTFLLLCTDVNQPTKTKPIITTQNIVCHKVECGKSSGNTAMSVLKQSQLT